MSEHTPEQPRSKDLADTKIDSTHTHDYRVPEHTHEHSHDEQSWWSQWRGLVAYCILVLGLIVGVGYSISELEAVDRRLEATDMQLKQVAEANRHLGEDNLKLIERLNERDLQLACVETDFKKYPGGSKEARIARGQIYRDGKIPGGEVPNCKEVVSKVNPKP